MDKPTCQVLYGAWRSGLLHLYDTPLEGSCFVHLVLRCFSIHIQVKSSLKASLSIACYDIGFGGYGLRDEDKSHEDPLTGPAGPREDAARLEGG